MIKIAICDDEKYIRSYLASLIRRQDYETEITEYDSADSYLSNSADCDLLFLDIELDPNTSDTFLRNDYLSDTQDTARLSASIQPINKDSADTPAPSAHSAPPNPSEKHMNGMELARKIRTMNPERQPLILFVTGYENYVYDAFDVDAFQYILKPIDEDRFSEIFRRAADRILARAEQQQKKLIIQHAGTSRVLPLNSIYYMESQGHKVILHLKGTTLEYYARLRELEQELQGQFCRIHKGFLVNLAYVEAYTKTEVILTNGERLNLSKYKYDNFVKAHLHFIQSSG